MVETELDVLKPIDLEDYTKNQGYVKKVSSLKEKIQALDGKLKDIDDVQKDIVRQLTEQDMENSVDLLGLKATELKERLVDAQKHLKTIGKSGEEMEGNTSNKEEEEFIFALKNEMPEVFENIDSTFELL